MRRFELSILPARRAWPVFFRRAEGGKGGGRKKAGFHAYTANGTPSTDGKVTTFPSMLEEGRPVLASNARKSVSPSLAQDEA